MWDNVISLSAPKLHNVLRSLLVKAQFIWGKIEKVVTRRNKF